MTTAPLIHVSALQALIHCERMFYLEAVEAVRTTDDRVYAGRTLLDALEEGPESHTFTLADAGLGLTGTVEAVRRPAGAWVPIEHRRGRPHRGDHGVFEAWPADGIQVSAYGMLLERVLEQPVAEGRLRYYHGDNVTVRVPLDATSRLAVRQAVRQARDLLRRQVRPPVTNDAWRCLDCSLASACLSEPARLSG